MNHYGIYLYRKGYDEKFLLINYGEFESSKAAKAKTVEEFIPPNMQMRFNQLETVMSKIKQSTVDKMQENRKHLNIWQFANNQEEGE